MDTLWLHIVQWLHTVGLHIDGGTARAVGDAAANATAQLDMPSLLALAAALGWASGFRLYAVVFLVGMMGVLGWMPLPPGLAVLQSPLVLMVSGALLVVEFFADKVPWVDSAWDAAHAFIRVPAGAALAYGVFGADNAGYAVPGGVWCGAGGDGGRVGTAAGGAVQVFARRGAALVFFLFWFCQGGLNVQKDSDCKPR